MANQITSALITPRSLTVGLSLAFAGSILMALMAQIRIYVPFSPVPITGQTFGVLFLGAVLGGKIGALSMVIYIAEGLSGIPVFAGVGSGPAYLLGPTGGYLIGFIPAAFLVGMMHESGWGRKIWASVLIMILGTTIIFAFGIAGLALTAGFIYALEIGLYPFIPGALLKILFATGLTATLNRPSHKLY
jgi:biotin transport system substrate-specific component